MKKNKDLGLLKKVQKQERLRGDFGSANYFGKVGSYSMQGMNIQFQCLTQILGEWDGREDADDED